MISKELLEKYGGKQVHLNKGAFLFYEGDPASNYYEVVEGSIKMVNFSEDGHEFTQGIFEKGDSFGEPPLFAGMTYPSNAVATEDTTVWKLPRENFFNMLKDNFEVHLDFTVKLCQRIHYKATIMRGISSHAPEHRIITFIDYLKEISPLGENQPYEVPFTRQQIADMTGLRVETVIRTIKALEQQGKVFIKNRKVYR
jgi:CRP-like cAMP-binding protein